MTFVGSVRVKCSQGTPWIQLSLHCDVVVALSEGIQQSVCPKRQATQSARSCPFNNFCAHASSMRSDVGLDIAAFELACEPSRAALLAANAA